MILYLILALIIIIPLIILISPTLEYKIRLLIRARKDYLDSRGTLHLKQLKHSLSNLDDDIFNKKDHKGKLLNAKETFIEERSNNLERRLIVHLVNTDLEEAYEIGPILKNRIINECFDGTLSSLHDTYQVHGIGEIRAYEIKDWAKKIDRELPELLKRDFPDKEEIMAKYAPRIESLDLQVDAIEKALRPMYDLDEKAATEISRLSQIRLRDFYSAHNGNLEASKKVEESLIGTFPEWDRTPDWFKSLIKKYGN